MYRRENMTHDQNHILSMTHEFMSNWDDELLAPMNSHSSRNKYEKLHILKANDLSYAAVKLNGEWSEFVL